jgi:hypothetical protein
VEFVPYRPVTACRNHLSLGLIRDQYIELLLLADLHRCELISGRKPIKYARKKHQWMV